MQYVDSVFCLPNNHVIVQATNYSHNKCKGTALSLECKQSNARFFNISLVVSLSTNWGDRQHNEPIFVKGRQDTRKKKLQKLLPASPKV